MGFEVRLGGWRPVQMEHGDGALRLASGERIESVQYRFEVWHQMIDGFPGPFRAEGRIELPKDAATAGGSSPAVLILEDGRFLALRLSGDGTLLAHDRPSKVDPGESAD